MTPSVAKLLASLMICSASGAQAASIVNGNFEAGNLTGWSAAGAVQVVSDSALRPFGAVGNFPTGVYVANLGGGDATATDVLSQVVDTVMGQQYLLQFDYGGYRNTGCCAGSQTIVVSAANVANGATLASTDLAPEKRTPC